eukprot:jgi/Picsp_1/1835/NSC_05302-R1_protein
MNHQNTLGSTLKPMERSSQDLETNWGPEKSSEFSAETYKYGTWYDPNLPKIRKRIWNFEVEMKDSGGKFTYEDWRRKQSWLRYLFQPVPLCRSLYQEIPLLIMVTVVTIFAGLYHDLLQTKHEGWLVLVSANYFLPYYFLSMPLSLLLVFKTNNCFDRWWEARKNLGEQQNHLRNASRLTCAWVYPQEPELAAAIVRLMSVLAPAAGAWFLHDLDLLQKNSDLLTQEEFRYVVECNQPPVAVGAMISRYLHKSSLHQFERIAIEDEIGQFMNTLGSLNRLSTMPIYLSYSRNCLRMTMWFLFGLPFALWASMSWMTLVAVLVTTVLLASIENIGTQIEQPLLVLPIETITSNTRRHVQATMQSIVSLDGSVALLPCGPGGAPFNGES